MAKRTCVTILAIIGGVTIFGCVILFVMGVIGNPPPANQVAPTARVILRPTPTHNPMGKGIARTPLSPVGELTPTYEETGEPALTYEQICTRPKEMTDVQWNEHLKQFSGQKVTSWEGWVKDVYKYSSGYTLYVTFDPPNHLLRGSAVHFVIPEDIALMLEKDDIVTFSGTIKSIGTFLGVCSGIELEHAVIEKIQK